MLQGKKCVQSAKRISWVKEVFWEYAEISSEDIHEQTLFQ